MKTFGNTCAVIRKPFVAACAVAAFALLAMAPSAQAKHNMPSVVTHATVEFGHDSSWSWRRDRDRCWEDCEYDRGHEIGKGRGFDAGYRDGIRGFCYDNRPTASLCERSGPFRDGYYDGFEKGYKQGFEAGRRERSCSRPICRPAPQPRCGW